MLNLSILIPVYNSAKTIKRTIDSVLLKRNIDYEIIIIDDGSTDNTVSVLADYEKIQNIKILYNR